MFSKTSAASKKKIRVVNETPTKLHTASIHLKTQEDRTLDWSRLPLKQLIQQRKEQDFHNQTSLKKLLKVDYSVLATTRVKESSRSAKKISVQEIGGTGRCSGLLNTDRKEHKSKRLRTENDNMFDDSNCIKNDSNYLRMMHEYEEENKKLKHDLKKKKECVEVRAEDLVALLNQYEKLKLKNKMFEKQLQYYKSQLSSEECNDPVLKVLTQ